MEIWKDVVGYEGVYSVSSHGQVRREKPTYRTRKGFILKQQQKKNGYKQICLSSNDISKYFLVHKLVAEAFLGERRNGMTINHIDNNKTNNCISNLEFVSIQENISHNMVNGIRIANAKLNNDIVKHIRSISNPTAQDKKDLAAKYGVSRTIIYSVMRGKAWKHV